jgi:tetratricopeptide (TPR) repeat protein
MNNIFFKKNKLVILHVTLLLFIPFIVYFNFRWNPIVFDDLYFFDGVEHSQFFKIFDFSIRWLPYATFEWTKALFGSDVIWLHFGNNLIHAANGVFLYFLLNYLFSICIKENSIALSLRNTAFFSAFLFMLHPASVYSVNYISQRSMLMATFFAIAMMFSFVESIHTKNKKLLFFAVFLYGMSVLCKEHAIMLPALAFFAALLLVKDIKKIFKYCWPYFLLCFFIAIYVVIQIKSINLYGNPYESGASELLSRLQLIDPSFRIKQAYFYSVYTQMGLFFKYLLLWIIPSSMWMSIDMYETFATRFLLFPQLVGAISFLVYPIFSVWLIKKNDLFALLGFALICPWLLFLTEITTVRIQESFVIYRSYIWMVFFTCALPFVIQKISSKKAIGLLCIISIMMVPLTLQRLISFSHPLLLWDDAARLVEGKENRPGVERVYHNRGLAYLQQKQYKLAIEDFNKALEIWPQYNFVYNDRGAAYLELQDYQQAINDFNQSILLKPNYFRPYLGRAHIFELMGQQDQAKQNYAIACNMGLAEACAKR